MLKPSQSFLSRLISLHASLTGWAADSRCASRSLSCLHQHMESSLIPATDGLINPPYGALTDLASADRLHFSIGNIDLVYWDNGSHQAVHISCCEAMDRLGSAAKCL